MGDPVPVTHRYATVNGVRLHYVESGVGAPVILLHGFPQPWSAWRHQIPALASAGRRVIAPDMRGYNLSDKPRGVRAYEMSALVEDVAALVAHVGAKRASIVGHDFGGAVAWAVAMLRPDVLDRLVIINAPHPLALARELRSWEQRRRSWYVLAFQLPRLPEMLLRFGDFAVVERLLRRDPARAGAFSDADVARHKEALAKPGALTAMVNYYRAVVRHRPKFDRAHRAIEAPTMLVWGGRDRFLASRLADGLERWVPGIRVERLPEASHWVMADAPDELNDLLIDFLGWPSRGSG